MLDMASWLVLKGVMSVCKLIGYRNCARMAAMSLGMIVDKS